MADVKLFRPQRLTDNPDGGGLATATEIVDGEVNNLFDDISRIDRVNGELSLRKVFPIAATPDTELFADVHVIIQAPPMDPRVSGVVFRTKSWGDERADAQAYVERYLDPSVITRMIPYDRQLEGQRTVLVYQRPELALPEIGEVYDLQNDTTEQIEFFRVQDVDHEVQTFTDTSGDYQVRVITMTISQPLTQEFSGSQPNRYFTIDNLKSSVRSTVASDAARYKGVVTLAVDAEVGDLSITVDSIFTQLVPSATSEVGIVEAPPAGTEVLMEAGSAALTTAEVAMDLHPTQLVFMTAAQRGVVVQMSILGDVWVEQLDGSFLHTAGTDTGTLQMRSDRRGVLLSGFSTGTRRISATYLPAVAIGKSGVFHQIPVQIQNRGYVYLATLRPIPEPGTLAVSFRAQGKWYTLTDDGTGALRAGTGIGSGLLNLATGTVSVSLAALPDVGSSVLYAWGAGGEYEVRTDDVAIEVPAVEIQLEAGSAEPATLTLTWESGGVGKSASANAAGTITGDATGRVVHATGEVLLRPTMLPDSNTVFEAIYEAGETAQETFTPSAAGGSIVLTASSAPLRPGSVQVDLVIYTGQPGLIQSKAIRLTDDGTGGMREAYIGAVVGASINYSTGVVTIPGAYAIQAAGLQRADFGGALPSRLPDTVYVVGVQGMRWPVAVRNEAAIGAFINGGAINLRYKLDSAIDATRTEEYEAGPLRVDLTPRVSNSIVPGGLIFAMGGRTYYDRQGVLYYAQNVLTGAGLAAGTIDYETGVVSLSSYAGGVVPAFSLKALLTEVRPLPLSIVHGHTPGSPLRPGTFYIQANRYSDGQIVSGLADNNGNIDNADMHGVVDSVTGVYAVAFGRYVLDSSLDVDDKAEDWYDADNVGVDGYIWRPAEVIPGTVTFNCVVQVSLPQDPEIIKVNPVRLPMDGRVPVIRAGDTLVIHDPQPFTMPGGLVAGQVVTLPRTGLASVALYDQLGLGVPGELFELDAEAGELTMATPLNLSAYTQPIVAIHTIEDMALCLDAQITGEVSLGQALTHGYAAGNSLVSSAQILGDAQARYANLFAQGTWTGVWSDELIGSPPAGGAQYNDSAFPVVVLNRDAITQRWRLAFTSTTAFNIVGEEVGVVGTGSISTGASPVNPATGEPYFTVLPGGFGTGWSVGNNIPFATIAAGGPLWVARTVRSGPATNFDDLMRLQLRWDKD